jgi:hypothetical protein
MKPRHLIAVLLSLCAPLFATDTRTLSVPCEKALNKAMLLAAYRKWSPMRPSPNAMVLNIGTHRNFAKTLLPLGSVWSHSKFGELAFDDVAVGCKVFSNGHPADVVNDDLDRSFSHAVAKNMDSWWTTEKK